MGMGSAIALFDEVAGVNDRVHPAGTRGVDALDEYISGVAHL